MMNKRYVIIALIFVIAACSAPKTASVKKPTVKLEKAPDGYVYHQVLRGETIFGIAQKYNLTVEATQELNKDIGGVIKAGQIIKIRTAKDEKKPIVKTDIKPKKPNTPLTNISLLLPFNASQSLDTTNVSDDSDDRSSYKSTVAIEFYEGVLMALDSLKKEGLSVRLSVFDTQNDSLVVKRLMNKVELKESSIIIGPFANAQLACLNTFSLLQHALLVSPLSSVPSKLARQNPYANIAVPSVNMQCKQMANYIANNFSKANIIVTHHSKGSSTEYAAIFKNIISLKLNGRVSDINISDVGNKGIYNSLSPTQNNIIVVTSSNEAFVTELLTGLSNRKDKYQITVVGLPTWDDFETIDMTLFQNVNTYIFKAYYIDVENSDLIQFRKKYLANYKSEPSSYVYQGFDVMYYYGKLVLKDSKKLIDNVPVLKVNTMHTQYDFDSEFPGSGYENQYISVLKFQDYRLVKMNK